MSACVYLDHTVAAYSAIQDHRVSVVVLIVIEFVPHFELLLQKFVKGNHLHLGVMYLLFIA